MKKSFVLALAALVMAPVANAAFTVDALSLHRAMEAAQPLNLINWQVGDYQNFSIDMLFGKGTGSKKATAEDTARNAVWLVTEMNILGQQQKVEALIGRADGKTLELIVNGQRQNPEQGGEIEIISQEETEITVPAGRFECLHVKARQTTSQGVADIELWANPIDVNLDGMLKMSMKQGFMQITLILEKFGHN